MASVQNELLASLPIGERSALGAHFESVTLSHDAVLHDTGEPIERVFFPESGAISLVIALASGEIIESALVGSDGAVGGFAAIQNRPALSRAVVQIECRALAIPAERLRQLCGPDSVLATLLGLHNQFLFAQAQQAAACNAAHPLEARLSRWLLRAHDLCGKDLALTQESLAAFLGVRRTSVSLTAHALQEAGIIRYRRGAIEILDRDRLQKASCECHAAVRAQRARLLLEDEPSKLATHRPA